MNVRTVLILTLTLGVALFLLAAVLRTRVLAMTVHLSAASLYSTTPLHDSESLGAELQSAPVWEATSFCPANCSGHGQCHFIRTGGNGWSRRCACNPGWGGEACERREGSPCNTPAGGRVLTRCAGTCDDDVNRCYCGPHARFPKRPMMHCQYDHVERDMPWQTPAWAGFTSGPKDA